MKSQRTLTVTWGSVGVDSSLMDTPIVSVGLFLLIVSLYSAWCPFCSFAIISLRKRELVALLLIIFLMSCGC